MCYYGDNMAQFEAVFAGSSVRRLAEAIVYPIGCSVISTYRYRPDIFATRFNDLS